MLRYFTLHLNKGSIINSTIVLQFFNIKLLYSANIVAQFCLLNHILGSHDFTYGFTLLRDIMNEIEWEKTGHFFFMMSLKLLVSPIF